MENFNFYAPTYFAFGKGKESEVGALVKRFGGSKVLLHYGGGSIKRNGAFDSVVKSLKEAKIPYVELGGVKPNPRSGLVYEGIELCRKEGVDFVLNQAAWGSVPRSLEMPLFYCRLRGFQEHYTNRRRQRKAHGLRNWYPKWNRRRYW